MGVFSNPKLLANSVLLSAFVVLACFAGPSAGNFYRDAEITWGDGRAKILEGGRGLSLSLDQQSGSGFQSKNEYLYGRFDLQLKLVPGNSAGTVTTFFHLKEKDMTKSTLSFWAIFLVDNSPIRVFNNHKSIGIPFPTSQPMRVLCSLWNADDWATQGGRVKTDWTRAPFVAYYRNFKIDGCPVGRSSGESCGFQSQTQELDAKGRNRMRWVQQKHMIYNYCADVRRFPQGTSAECKRSRF
ncbi:Xyloglucan endotransglucosylase/hydrolase 2 [Sesamum angolense]|uniref:Xyloglucan endotransglucosylase/hydrolase n=1 Tax=Sesamum angolense TaxID=2727404 RepID=A0AAE2BUL3_9LAMI|nr:Xyloglucan endotransglucosylase/hydrolase 2 [Sesamum angolense]